MQAILAIQPSILFWTPNTPTLETKRPDAALWVNREPPWTLSWQRQAPAICITGVNGERVKCQKFCLSTYDHLDFSMQLFD